MSEPGTFCQAPIGGMYEVSLGFVHWQVLTGAPGTGKTTFARLLYRFMHAHGILPSKSEKFIGVPSFWVDHSFVSDVYKSCVKETTI